MKKTATCPSCNKQINLFHIVMALTPFTFKCGHCHTRIFVKGITLWILSLIAVVGMLVIFTLQYIFASGNYVNYWFFAIPAAIIIALEITTSLLACNKARLVCKGGGNRKHETRNKK